MNRSGWLLALLVGMVLVLPSSAAAQASIAGVVTDSTGAVMVGVTVDVSSPALIEKVRTTTTNDAGRYQVLNLRPGLYSVTFMLDGFRTVKRDNIELQDGFTAPVNAQLEVGARSEEIVVQASAPLVDVVNLANPQTITSEMLTALPLGNRTTAEILSAVPGVAAGGLGALTYRGSGDTLLTVDGNRSTFLNAFAGPGAMSLTLAAEAYQEYSVTTAIDAVDSGTAGMRINVVPKDGGNRFATTGFVNYQGLKWTSDNIEDKYKVAPFNFTQGTGNRSALDVNPSVGGPIIRDKLWFQSTFRYGNTVINNLGFYHDRNPDPRIYEADLTRGVFNNNRFFNGGTRVTWQASLKDKVSGYYDNQYRDVPYGFFGGTDPIAVAHYRERFGRNTGVKWTRTQTARLLIEAQVSGFAQHLAQSYNGAAEPWSPAEGAAETSFRDLPVPTAAISSYAAGFTVTNQSAGGDQGISRTYTSRAEATYVIGAHTLRMGGSLFMGRDISQFRRVGDIQYNITINTVGGVPVATPTSISANLPTNIVTDIDSDIGLWFQEQWTFNRLTTKLGVRYDGLRTGYPDQFQPESPWLGELRFPGGKILNWNDITPRVSVAYDLFGNGRTAIKGGFARFVAAETIGTSRAANPMSLIDRTATGTVAWTDLDGNRTVFNDDRSIQWDEINNGTPFQGRFQDSTFGLPVQTTQYDPDVLEGWYKRGYSWETNLAVDHQLLPRLATTLTYYHRVQGNQTVTDNLNYDSSAENWSGPFCLRAPTHPNLPGGGGYDVCGLYDQTDLGATRAALPTTVVGLEGTPANLVTFRKDAGTGKGMTQVTDGFEISLNGRLPRGAFLGGGIDIRSLLTDQCDPIDTPELRFCRSRPNWTVQPRISGSFTLQEYGFLGVARQAVEGIQVSGIYRANRGPALTASWTACDRITATCLRNDFDESAAAGVTPTLGRPLRSVAGQKTIALIEPNAEFYPYQHLFDLRFAKSFNVQGRRFTLTGDMYNAFNNGSISGVNNTFGLTSLSDIDRVWQRPTGIIAGRSYRVGANFAF